MEYDAFGLCLDHTVTKGRNNAYTMHAHEEYELFFLVSGQRRYFVGQTIYDIAPGNAIFIPRTVLHRTVSLGSKGYDRYVLTFSQKHYDAFVALSGWDACASLSQGGCLQLGVDGAYQVQRAFEKMELSFAQGDKWSQAAVTNQFYEILLTCLREGKSKEPCQEESADKIQQAARYISEHYHEWITLSDVASQVHMEKTYFSKRFKALIGSGFLEYLTQTRLLSAKELLVKTDLSIGEISDACGFSNSNYFGDVFRRYYGCSPTEYRKGAFLPLA